MTDDSTNPTEPTEATEATESAATSDTADPTRRSGEAALAWLARIAPDDWEATESGYGLVLQSAAGSGDRRIVVDPFDDQATFDERVESEFGDRWVQRERIDEQWYLQTTAGLLLWTINDINDSDDTDDSDDQNASKKTDDREGDPPDPEVR
jgi:hypothetical protein